MQLNPATVWAETVVDELARGGLRAVCVAPGSRSTPLTLAFAAHPGIRVYRHLDERSAGFFALGMALLTQRPAAVLSTSGTATANFLPAVVEAKMSQAPLLVLTADRPPELRHSGANQTIDQVKLYGDQVLWAVDVALPEPDAGPVALRNLRTLAARALGTAGGLVKGPVHLNFPFRKPFEPEGAPQPKTQNSREPFTQIERGVMVATEAQLARLAALIDAHSRGLIVCGPRAGVGHGLGDLSPGEFSRAVAALSRRTGYPILADALSGVRFGPWVAETVVCGGYETYLRGKGPDWEPPQVVLRFGAAPTSKWLNAYLDRQTPAHFVHVRASGVWADDSHRTRYFLQADEGRLCRELAERVARREESAWAARVAQTEARFWQRLARLMDGGPFFDGQAVADMLARLPDGALLFAGNSLPVRHVDQYARPRRERLQVFANRGASGIDGNTSTALGIAAASGQRVTLLSGDVTFYHDLNGLLAAREEQLPLTAVVLNNDGGGIFRRLPVARFDPPFTELFLTPHGLDFSAAAEMYGLDYVRVSEREALLAALSEEGSGPRVLEVVTDGARDYERQREIAKIMGDTD
ncbi:MAG TPA: 2-succinyl-5-enolpyruvyl-6-hydroxy-3-cyclohexene-1-carboxylic-acid synthase [Candidatus Sulfomarinibacteraceae bacterium]|nr:2-succinyl-5-enolpyruvyl-6-hydroxy-3-cyclohexene-1-carboxylic-acid synthase [Candidatus Sulfomarinibacteraceae bacterium]